MEEKKTELHILHTKLNRPPVAQDILVRPLLLKKIAESCKLPLFLISAPAGYGKSTLVSSWLEVCEYPSAWVSVGLTNGGTLRKGI
jgi:LuxR family maltose regulon positive regulatory protein